MDCHAAEQINWTFGIWIMFSFTIHWTASNEEHDNHASNQLNTYPDLMPATESCRGVNDTYPELMPAPEPCRGVNDKYLPWSNACNWILQRGEWYLPWSNACTWTLQTIVTKMWLWPHIKDSSCILLCSAIILLWSWYVISLCSLYLLSSLYLQ